MKSLVRPARGSLADPAGFWSPASTKRILFRVLLLLAFAVCAEDFAGRIVPLIDPAKLAPLGKRGANSRVQKCVYWLEDARKAGESPEEVAQAAVAKGYTKEAAKLTTAELLRNLDIAGKLGCLDEASLAKMRRGNAPVVTKAGQIASFDHIIPARRSHPRHPPFGEHPPDGNQNVTFGLSEHRGTTMTVWQ